MSESQLSRTAQKALGWDHLKRAQESIDNMWALQNAVLTAMNARDTELANLKQITLVERSPADMWAYTKMWCERLDIDYDSDSRAQEYHDHCMRLAERYAAYLIVPITDAVPFVEEPNRADLASRIPVAETIIDFLTDIDSPIHLISRTSPQERIDESALFIQTIINSTNRD